MIPEANVTSLCTQDTIVIMSWKNHGMQTVTREREGKQVALRVDMKHDGVKNLSGLAREGATGWRKPDKGFNYGEEVYGEFVLVRSESVLAPTDARSKGTDEPAESVYGVEGVSAVIR